MSAFHSQPRSARRYRRQLIAGGAMAKKSTRRWSAGVTKHSDALDLKRGVFTWKDPKRIAASLKQSAETSRRKKADSYRSAISMLTFYINRGGSNLSATQRRVLMRAKNELRKQFGRE
jgi:Protein of unknown function (DUF3175)